MTGTRRPNVVYIDCHDLGDWLGCYDWPYLRTPHLNQMAREGALFTQQIAAAPICQPSRSAIITGRMPHTVGVTSNQDPIDLDHTCMPAYFAQAGYRTLLVGRMKLPNDPQWAGFQTLLPASDRPEEDVAAGFLADDASGAQPFFLSISFQLIHRPYGLEFDSHVAERVVVPPPLPDNEIVRKDLAAQCFKVEQLDAKVGRILDSVTAAGLEDQTIVVFTTDHGVGIARSKHTLYDPGLQTALLMKCPPVITPGARYGELLSNVDLMPTLLELAGVPVPEGIDGRSFLGLLRGTSYERRPDVFAEYTWGQRAIYTEDAGPMAALGIGWRLLRARVGRSVLVWLVSVGLGIGAGIAGLIVLLPVLAVFGGLGYAAIAAGGFGAPLIAVGALGVLALFAVGVLFTAIVNTFFWTYWTRAYLRLAA